MPCHCYDHKPSPTPSKPPPKKVSFSPASRPEKRMTAVELRAAVNALCHKKFGTGLNDLSPKELDQCMDGLKMGDQTIKVLLARKMKLIEEIELGHMEDSDAGCSDEDDSGFEDAEGEGSGTKANA